MEDIQIAERIFGPDVPTIKGKLTRTTPKAVRNDIIELPPELYARNQDLILCIDTMYVNGMGFLLTIDTSIRYRTAVHIQDRSKKSYYEAIDVIF